MAHKELYEINKKNYTFAIPIFECESAASQSSKYIDLSDISLDYGSMIRVRFINGNTASSISINGKVVNEANSCNPTKYSRENCIMSLVYDGTHFIIIG